MAICGFGINIGLDKTINQMKCDIQNTKFVLRKKKIKFNSGIQRFDILSKKIQRRRSLRPEIKDIITISPP